MACGQNMNSLQTRVLNSAKTHETWIKQAIKDALQAITDESKTQATFQVAVAQNILTTVGIAPPLSAWLFFAASIAKCLEEAPIELQPWTSETEITNAIFHVFERFNTGVSDYYKGANTAYTSSKCQSKFNSTMNTFTDNMINALTQNLGIVKNAFYIDFRNERATFKKIYDDFNKDLDRAASKRPIPDAVTAMLALVG